MNLDELCMQLAIEKAWEYQLLTYPNPAVGAVVTYRGRIVSIEAHQKAGTSHAEVLALLSAYEAISGTAVDFDRFDADAAHNFLLSVPRRVFSECTLHVTLEPCSHKGKTPSCASLLSRLHPARVVIALADPVAQHSGGVEMLKQAGIKVDLHTEEASAKQLLEPFVIWQKRAFVLFKLAQTMNGRIGGGYLSSHTSLTHVHRLRSVCDRLLIGGNTVREDRPTLDCRFTGEAAPDIAIYSRQELFDRSIPLFGVEGRDVTIGGELDFLQEPSFVLVEGGEGMLRALSGRIDWYLFYQTPKLSSHNLTYNIDKDLTFLHGEKKGVDMMIWSKERDG